MADQQQYLTPEGYASLESKLKYLIEVRRPEVAERLRMALQETGELTENAEFEDAKNDQAFLEAEITRITNILRNARIIQDSGDSDTVGIGSRVVVRDAETGDEDEYHIVDSAEANPRAGKLSFKSPVGKALMGKKVGDKIVVKVPDGDLTFVIKKIE